MALKDALEAGVPIEKTGITRVYTGALNGSGRHLEAFEANLEALCLAP